MLFHHKASADGALTIQLYLKAKLPQEAPKAKLPRSTKLHGSELLQFLGEPKGGVELNHQGDVHTHIPLIINQSSSKYFEICTIPLQIYENFEGGFVDTLKKTRLLTSLNKV